MRLLLCNLSVVLCHRRLAVWDIDARVDATCAILWVCGDNFETISINTARKGVPERILDHARKTVNRVLGQTSLIKNYAFPVMVSSERELL